jgi:phosphate starvation-inducible PhoH-like protein
MLKTNKIQKIILTRPTLSVDEELGFLPGNLEKKLSPYMTPIMDIFLEFYNQREIQNMLYNHVLEIAPLGFMRGRTFKNSYIIADEMQNSSPNQMLTLLTRLGENSKMVITGDLEQSDFTGTQINGLQEWVVKLKNKQNLGDIINSNICLFEMDALDIQRSPLVVDILKIYS